MDDLLVALRMIVALAAVLGLLFILSRRMQKGTAKDGNPLSALVPGRWGGRASRSPKSTVGRARPRPEKITVVARSGLGGKAQLVVAEFGGIRYVLGVTEHGVNVVDTQEAPVEMEYEVPADPDADPDPDPDIDSDAMTDGNERPLKSVA